MTKLNRRLSVAPMMDCTDRYDRYFLRLISRHTLLYTEMITTGAILHGDRERLLGLDRAEHPVALQLGGSDPEAMALSARVGAGYGYDEINLNVGCPSDRVQSGRFGACLMAEPELVAECVGAIVQAVSIPVTVKTRIGIDDQDSFEALCSFVETVASSGASVFIIHARKAWLTGLSPKQNRTVPPLRYDVVRDLKETFPHLTIILNGGIETLDDAEVHLKNLDGVMIGRAAYQMPYMLAQADRQIFDRSDAIPTREEIVDELLGYVAQQRANGVPLQRITRHLTGLFHGQPGGRLWRRHLSENAHKQGAGSEVLRDALACVEVEKQKSRVRQAA